MSGYKSETKNRKDNLKGLGFLPSFSIYILASIAMLIQTRYLIPFLSYVTGMEIVLSWFIVAALGIFSPLLLLAFFIIKHEGFSLNRETWRGRMRFSSLSAKDWAWSIGSLIIIALLSALMMKTISLFVDKIEHAPPFMAFEPLTADRYWLLLAWLPYWILNIMGEEILWRGTMLPRQEIAFGKWTWLVHGTGWALFHVAFGWQLLLTLLPIIFIQPYVVQRRKNSWVGVIIHAGLNGPSFAAIALGII